jgi:sigma-B regulation protein RsbU (phosphoserine phosphatase)
VSPPDRLVSETLPDPVLKALGDFEEYLDLVLRLVVPPEGPGAAVEILYATKRGSDAAAAPVASTVVVAREGPNLELQILSAGRVPGTGPVLAPALARTLERAFAAAREMRFFTVELTERYEEIHLLYSISETLGSVLRMDEAARVILGEVCDVMGAKRGSLWLHDQAENLLRLAAAVGGDGRDVPLPVDHPDAITALVFREQRPVIASRAPSRAEREQGILGDSFLSVPISYTPPSGESRTLGAMNLIGRRGDEKYSAADQRLLSAIASQVGSALENKRLHEDSLSRERMGREMELAHDLQQKLLPDAGKFEGAEAAARVVPAVQVGGDFYQLYRLSDARVGVMLGDVSLHGFPSALIMTLTISAAGILALEHDSPARFLRALDDALRDELETTEMFLTVFYGVLDPQLRMLTFSNAGHPHAFVVREGGAFERLLATDPPVGFAGPDAYREETIEWEPGSDLLLLFTDGLSDTLASATRRDGEERVLDTVVTNRHGPVARIVDELFALTSGAEPPILGDDRTALVVRTPEP